MYENIQNVMLDSSNCLRVIPRRFICLIRNVNTELYQLYQWNVF